MTLAGAYIILRRMRFHAYHGVLPQERQVGNDYELTLRMGLDAGNAAVSDDIADTVSYSEAYEVVSRVMKTPSHLLEHVAANIAEKLSEEFPQIVSIDISISKLNPPISGACCDAAEVELHYER